MIPVFCRYVIVGTYGRKKINRYVITKEIYAKYAKPLEEKISKSDDPNDLFVLKRMKEELFGDYMVEGAPLFQKLTKLKKDSEGNRIKCSVIDLGPYLDRL